jgi:DNA-directed RNA polymerase specialized sigma subunit
MSAVDRFDPEVASRLSTKENENVFAKYADKRVRGKMLDHISVSGDIPKSHRKRAKNISALSSPEAPTELTAQPATPKDPE